MSTSSEPKGAFGASAWGKKKSSEKGLFADSGATRKSPHKSPLEDFEPTGDLEKDMQEEDRIIGDAYKGFLERSRREKARFDFSVDASFWSGVCFKSTQDLQLFLDAVGMGSSLYENQHMDGYELAEKLGLNIEFKDRDK